VIGDTKTTADFNRDKRDVKMWKVRIGSLFKNLVQDAKSDIFHARSPTSESPVMCELFILAIDCQELLAVVAVVQVAAAEVGVDWDHMEDSEDSLEVGHSLAEGNLAEDSRHIVVAVEVPIDQLHTL
jgi:hypothetical protein